MIRNFLVDFLFLPPSLNRLLSHIKTLVRWRDIVHAPLNNWFDETGRLLLVGQAAHPDSPAGNHPAALCVEDAVVLGGLFQRLARRSQIKRLLSAFQDMREARWETIRASETEKLWFVTSPPNPKRDAIRSLMRRKFEKEKKGPGDGERKTEEAREENGLDGLKDVELEGYNDDEFKHMALEELMDFIYDASEEVETWWAEWGALLEQTSNDTGANDRNDGASEGANMFEGQIHVEKQDYVL